jgi:hypothetical protein
LSAVDRVTYGLALIKSTPDPAEMPAQCGTETPMLDLRERLVYSDFGSRRVGRW